MICSSFLVMVSKLPLLQKSMKIHLYEARTKIVSVLCVIGTGYVGLVTGTCLADLGNNVTCIDIVQEKIERLKQGILPIYEPGLEEMVERNMQAGRLHFTTDYAVGLENSEFIFIAVNTPTSNHQGGADMSYVESAARSIAEHLDHYAIIINKSTVPVGSGDVVSRLIRANLKRSGSRSPSSRTLNFCAKEQPSWTSSTPTALFSA